MAFAFSSIIFSAKKNKKFKINSFQGTLYNIYHCNGIDECGWDEIACQFQRQDTYSVWYKTSASSCQYFRYRECESNAIGLLNNQDFLILDRDIGNQVCTEAPDVNGVDKFNRAIGEDACRRLAIDEGNQCFEFDRIITNADFKQEILCRERSSATPAPTFPLGGNSSTQNGNPFPIWIPIVVVLVLVLLAILFAIWYCYRNFLCCFGKKADQNINEIFTGGVHKKPPPTQQEIIDDTDQIRKSIELNQKRQIYPISHAASVPAHSFDGTFKASEPSTIHTLNIDEVADQQKRQSSSGNYSKPKMKYLPANSMINSSIGPSVSERAVNVNPISSYSPSPRYRQPEVQPPSQVTSITMSSLSGQNQNLGAEMDGADKVRTYLRVTSG